MSKFDELKKLAQRSATGDDVDATDAMHKMLQGVDVLELLAIQAQLVAALKAAKTWHNGEKWRDSSDPSEVRAWEQHRDIISAAITAAEAKP